LIFDFADFPNVVQKVLEIWCPSTHKMFLKRSTMPKITVRSLEGEEHKLEAENGVSLMEPLRDAGLIDATCGGMASCGTCHVYLAENWLYARRIRRLCRNQTKFSPVLPNPTQRCT